MRKTFHGYFELYSRASAGLLWQYEEVRLVVEDAG
jgi:hypothetical protein